jgi:hypothetical protein
MDREQGRACPFQPSLIVGGLAVTRWFGFQWP